jgi:hypothetical protein
MRRRKKAEYYDDGTARPINFTMYAYLTIIVAVLAVFVMWLCAGRPHLTGIL